LPELPEVETIRRDLAPRVLGQAIRAVEVGAGPRYGDVSAVVGSRIVGLARRGKYLVFDLTNRELVVHLGMSGRLFVASAVPVTPHLRALFRLAAKRVLVFEDMRKFGTLAVVMPGDYRQLPTLAAMGPEPLSTAFELGPFASALERSGAPIKALLLGQKAVAGLGNIYADEALARAGIHPAARHLPLDRARALWAAIRTVLDVAIANRGTTFNLYRAGHGKPGNHYLDLRVYDRAGSPCHTCAATIVKIRVAGRGTHYCPGCQRD
jgi:formamidopyrimidine-DNA glycosylase